MWPRSAKRFLRASSRFLISSSLFSRATSAKSVSCVRSSRSVAVCQALSTASRSTSSPSSKGSLPSVSVCDWVGVIVYAYALSPLLRLVSVADVRGRVHLIQLLGDFVLTFVHLVGAELLELHNLFEQHVAIVCLFCTARPIVR